MIVAKTLVDRQYELIRQRDVAGLPELYAHDAFYAMPGIMVRPVELPALMRAWFAAFPDLRAEVTGWIETAGGVAVERLVTGTHTGAFLSSLGHLAPTGRLLSWEVADVVRVRDGRITAWRSYFDQAAIFEAAVPGGPFAVTAGSPA
ncbi:MAG TPA: ester cyclase [Micromonospora sp.]